MKLPVKRQTFLSGSMYVLAVAGLGAQAVPAMSRDRNVPAASANGPGADFPVVVGEPFTIGSTVWTPVDQLNYDALGLASVGEGGSGVTAAHKTLPIPSYVEVTALDTGRTILVRIERRGPMTNDTLIELAPQAATELGVASGGSAPVRVRRVNPPEQERAYLRAGNRASERMATPEGLLKVLRRKLADQSPAMPPPSSPPPMPREAPPVHEVGKADRAAKPEGPAKATLPHKASEVPGNSPVRGEPSKPAGAPGPVAATGPAPKVEVRQSASPTSKPDAKPNAKPTATPSPRQTSASGGAAMKAPSRGSVAVQVGTFASETNARALAARLGGSVSRSGKFWRVRMGPYESRAKAAPALEKAKRAGYSDARIQNVE